MTDIRAVTDPRGDGVPRRCSFCGKRQDEVAVLIVGMGANICDECTELCAEVVAEKRASDTG